MIKTTTPYNFGKLQPVVGKPALAGTSPSPEGISQDTSGSYRRKLLLEGEVPLGARFLLASRELDFPDL